MGEVIVFRPRPVLVVKDELAEVITWLKPASNWRIGRMQIELAHHLYMVTDYRRILVADNRGRKSPEHMDAIKLAEKAEHVWRIECLKQIFVPAEHVRHLRWKQDWLQRHGGGTAETALAIARDEAALADRLAAVARQQAGRGKAVRA